jgi:cell division septum initiation protein DivIVA
MDAIMLMEKLHDLLDSARPLPLTDQVRVDPEEINELLDAIRATIPNEVKQARWIVKERQEMLAEVRRECDRLLTNARAEAAVEVSVERVNAIAERQAAGILREARRTADTIRSELDHWVDETFAILELNLEKFLGAAQRGRERLLERSSDESVLQDGEASDPQTAHEKAA